MGLQGPKVSDDGRMGSQKSNDSKTQSENQKDWEKKEAINVGKREKGKKARSDAELMLCCTKHVLKH